MLYVYLVLGHYAIRFIPRENGVHYIHVMLDQNHIRGSPFRILVGESDPDPGLVCASGEGLVKGVSGQSRTYQINMFKGLLSVK